VCCGYLNALFEQLEKNSSRQKTEAAAAAAGMRVSVQAQSRVRQQARHTGNGCVAYVCRPNLCVRASGLTY